MSETPTRQSVIVGLFVTIALVLFAGGILLVGRINAAFSRTIEVTTVFADAGGLQPGDKVWFSGLEVGTVDDLGFDGHGVKIDLAIDQEAATHVPADALAKLGSDGLIGNKIVVLYGGTTGNPPLADGQVVATGESLSTEDMLAMFQENNANVLAITEDLKAVTAKLAAGEGSAGKLLADDELYDRVQATVASLETASANAERMTRSLTAFTANLDREDTLAHGLVADEELYASVQASVQDLAATADKAQSLVSSLEQAATNPDSAMGALLHDAEAGADVRQTIDNLNEGSRLLAEDLEAVQHNFLLRGFFKKKDDGKEIETVPPRAPALPRGTDDDEEEEPPAEPPTPPAPVSVR